MLDELTPKQLVELMPILEKLRLLVEANPVLASQIQNVLRELEENRRWMQ